MENVVELLVELEDPDLVDLEETLDFFSLSVSQILSIEFGGNMVSLLPILDFKEQISFSS